MDPTQIKEHMEVIGADGEHVGTVDRVEGDRIKLTKDDGVHGTFDQHRFIPLNLVADVEDDQVLLSATGDEAVMMDEPEDAPPSGRM